MAVLTRKEMLETINNGGISFTPPLDGFQLQPHAIDLRLGTTFYIPKPWRITEQGREAINVDPLREIDDGNSFDIVQLSPGQHFEILPNEFIIAATLEKIAINNTKLMAILYPRSSINRRGLSVDLSGIIDTGYSGTLMIPIQNNTNNQVIKVYPGERICQIVFEELISAVPKDTVHIHGLNTAKYIDANDQTLSSKKDKREEIDLIKKGNLDKLKKQYPIT
ncbi:MAG: dCTP deaminase [Candidatus Magasanikbacteria bacterium]|jgi:dCTP deaminase|nr:dCTP deaminase [Candidatus Magasanikbacteria bacterium]MBT4220676.1 dCTP deaminase [Candidatus Magasanikbacteria bacterium]MBT4350376.1 dCTP deaminase [Candidatus Magasanikbacteria bacterium]MBT4541826.1 dCTP deaminase [Candidatus Magasanikbacteria bacterium]MBT6252764.1 dCTP deaminase [Candidatus Magasanikbacteria bacterium]